MNRCERCGGAIESMSVTIDNTQVELGTASIWPPEELELTFEIKEIPRVILWMMDAAMLDRAWLTLELIRLGYSQPLLPPEAPNP